MIFCICPIYKGIAPPPQQQQVRRDFFALTLAHKLAYSKLYEFCQEQAHFGGSGRASLVMP